VIEQVIAAEGGSSEQDFAEQERAWQFCLQLRVLALLEDLRANYRPWSLDLRHRKRTCPPLAFLPSADERDGGLALLQAISDVRSRRSEQDPLLVLAGVPRSGDISHRAADGDGAGDENGAGDKDGLSYETWATTMRVDQSPSLRSAWPWVLRYPITRAELSIHRTGQQQPRARRSGWTLVWSGWSLFLVVALTLGGVVLLRHDEESARHRQEAARERQLTRLYCGGDLARNPHYLVRSAQSPGQCVGIDTTDSLEFVPGDGGVRLDGAVPGSGAGSAVGARISLADLERLIRSQNRWAEHHAARHITFVYAGALTSASDGKTGEMQAAGAARELAGVYAWQSYINGQQSVAVRIDIANGGQDMDSQVVMAQQIAAAARLDPTIVGVIGLGRDTPTSPDVVRELAAAGLAVIDTTNSDDTLSRNWNYFGLAATNAEEAGALRSEIARTADLNAVVFARSGDDDDTYSDEQSAAAQAMLRGAHFRLAGGGALPYLVSGDEPEFGAYVGQQSPLCDGRPSVIYLAGRSDDLASLMYLLQHLPSTCLAAHVTVLSGDDLTKSEVTGISNLSIPPNVTVYFAALTDVARTGRGSGLAQDVQNSLRLAAAPPYSHDPFFADGSVALAFDAAQVLDQAAEESGWERPAVPSWLRCMHFTDGATGQIWFSGERHGIDIVKITAAPGGDGSPSIIPLPYKPETSPVRTGPPCSP